MTGTIIKGRLTVRIFVFEYVTGGGMLAESPPPSLVDEGDLMLRALVEDLAAVPGVELVVTRDARLERPPPLPAEVVSLDGPGDFPAAWARCVGEADAVWPVAPESGGVLERIGRTVQAAGRLLLGCRPEAVGVAASKLATVRTLAARGVPVVPTHPLEGPLPAHDGCWVVKPDDGAGCLGARIVGGAAALEAWLATLSGSERARLVAQPFVPGTPASLCVLARDGAARLLSVNLQRVALVNEGFALLGCVVNGLEEGGDPVYAALAEAVAAALPGLWGCFGVDLVVTPHGPRVLEVNPRLTTSYAGLHRALGENPAALVLDLLDPGRALPRSARGGARVDVDLEYPCVA